MAGHIARFARHTGKIDGGSTHKVPSRYCSATGRPQIEWADDIRKLTGKQWKRRVAPDGVAWRALKCTELIETPNNDDHVL